MAPVIAVVAKVVTAVIAKITVGAIAKFVLTTALSIGVSKLIAKRAMSGASAGGDGGGRVQLPPATDNKLPVVYGSAFIGGPLTDAMLSTDQKTMWYVVTLCEVTDTSAGSNISFGNVYYDGKLVEFGTNGAVAALITNDNSNTALAQRDTRVAGYLDIYLFNNGSSSGTNTGGLTADQILSVANGVPADKAWDGSQAMTNAAFAIIKVKYSTDAGTTGAGALTVQVINTESGQTTGAFRPGSAILDYMVNTRYGCAIPLSRIDTASLTALNDYSDDPIDVTGGPSPTQARYRVNGPLDTAQDCLTNLQFLVDSCDSWLQYSELTGLWRVVINKAYDQSPGAQTLNQLFLVDSSNLIGGIELSPIDLNDTYNEVEVAYPNFYVKDQTDYQIIDLFQTNPSLLSENEAVNRLNITLPLVNNAVQAKYLAARRIYQSREDLVITFKLDFSGIQVEAGDVIRVDHETYGWGPLPNDPLNPSKLFRVNTVAEEKDGDGNLSAVIQAFEYNATVFVDDPVADFIPSPNTGLKDPNVFDQPGTPVITLNAPGVNNTKSFKVTSTVPTNGLILYMDYNYGDNANVQQHILYRTLQQSNGDPFTSSASTNVDVNDLPAGQYYWSTTARNNTSGRRSNASAQFDWTGSGIEPPVTVTSCNASSSGNTITVDTIANIAVGANVFMSSGTGAFAANTFITTVISNGSPTIFTVNSTPTTPLSNACITVREGGVNGNVLVPSGVTPGTYTLSTITVNEQGILTFAANGTGGGGASNAQSYVAIYDVNPALNDFTVATFPNSIANTVRTNGGGIEDLTTGTGPIGDGNIKYLTGGLTISNGVTGNYVFNSATDVYPALQKTASVATGFLETSNVTYPFYPPGVMTQRLVASSGSDPNIVYDTFGWWTLLTNPLGSLQTANTYYPVTATFQAVSASNIIIQSGLAFNLVYANSVQAVGSFLAWETVETTELFENEPKVITLQGVFRNGANSNAYPLTQWKVDAIRLVVKNPASNIDVWLSNPQLFISSAT
jgi:hypothetical protein